MTEEVKQLQNEPIAYLLNHRQRLSIVINPVAYKLVPTTVEWEMPLYAKPQTKKWAGLTKTQIDKLEKEFIGFPVPNIYNFVKAIEAKLKEKKI